MKILLIIVSIIGMAAVMGAVIVGNKTFDGTVAEKPYELGLSWDNVQKEREMSGWKIDILDTSSMRIGKNDLFVRATDRSGQPLDGADITLIMSRPSSAFYDSTFKMAATGAGKYRAVIDLPIYGYWNAKVLVVHGGKNIQFENTVFAAKGN